VGRIIFTDSIGQAVLHNGKPAPANRFSNWIPRAFPVGAKANRLSDGALSIFRYRDDFGASFDLTGIPVASEYVNMLEVDGDIAGTIGGTPTNMGSGGPTATVVAQASGAPRGVGYNGLVAKHVNTSTVGGNFFNVAGATIGRVYLFSAWLYIPTGSTVVDPVVNMQSGTSGSTIAHADLTKRDQWQFLACTATATATTIQPVVGDGSGPSGALWYSDLWLVRDVTGGAAYRPIDIADRLAYHLENGGTCEVDTGDVDGNVYATCGLAPGASAQPPVLSDKKNLEYTLSVSLVNLAGSPARMRCHYAA